MKKVKKQRMSRHRPGEPGHGRRAAVLSARSTERFAALVDAENTLIGRGGRLLPINEGETLLEVIGSHLEGMPVQVAAGNSVLRAYLGPLAERRWIPEPVGPESDAADRALVEVGRHYVSCGVTDLVVVSGDHFFAQLATIARLHVISRPGCLSRELRLAATTVELLPGRAALAKTVA